MQIDPTNLSIIRQLRDGRKSYKTIAETLGISENTVRSRVQRMTDAGLTRNQRTWWTRTPSTATVPSLSASS